MSYGGSGAPKVPDDLFDCALHLRNNLIGLTTQGGSEADYILARKKLMADPAGSVAQIG